MEGNQLELRILMLKNKLKAADVAEFVGKSPQTIRRYMCGSRRVSDELLMEIKRQTEDRLESDSRQTEVISATLEGFSCQE